MQEKVVYNGLDLFKLIAAVLVVLLHAIETTAWFPCEIKYVFTRLAVPFFFITSGFFFYNGLHQAENKKQYFWGYEKNLLRLFVVWALIIYLPFVVVTYVRNNMKESIFKIILLIIRRVFVIGPGPYWYLMALMWSTAFLYFCYNKRRIVLVAGIVLGFLLEISYSCFYGYLSSFMSFRVLFQAIYFVYSWEFNFIMYGIPFTGVGFLIGENNLNWRCSYSIIVLFISTVLRIVEYNLPVFLPSEFWNANCLSICFIPQALAYFMLGKSLKLNWEKKKSKTLRQLSSFIYFAHAILLYEVINPILLKYTNISIYSSSTIM